MSSKFEPRQAKSRKLLRLPGDALQLPLETKFQQVKESGLNPIEAAVGIDGSVSTLGFVAYLSWCRCRPTTLQCRQWCLERCDQRAGRSRRWPTPFCSCSPTSSCSRDPSSTLACRRFLISHQCHPSGVDVAACETSHGIPRRHSRDKLWGHGPLKSSTGDTGRASDGKGEDKGHGGGSSVKEVLRCLHSSTRWTSQSSSHRTSRQLISGMPSTSESWVQCQMKVKNRVLANSLDWQNAWMGWTPIRRLRRVSAIRKEVGKESQALEHTCLWGTGRYRLRSSQGLRTFKPGCRRGESSNAHALCWTS